MSRRALSVVIGLIGILLAFAMLFAMSVMGSLLADARTENITGPGVDIFLRSPFPGPDDQVVLEVAARGGKRAGIERIQVKGGGEMLAYVAGDGADWGTVVRGGKTRGEETATVRFRVPDTIAPGETLALTFYVDYVVAMSSGDGATFENDHRSDVLHLDVRIYTPEGRRWALVGQVGRAFLVFLLWFLVVWGIAGLHARLEAAPSRAQVELEGVGLVLGYLSGGFLGYWLFARPLMAGLGTDSTGLAVGLTLGWLVLPPAWLLHRAKRRRAARVGPGLPRAQVKRR